MRFRLIILMLITLMACFSCKSKKSADQPQIAATAEDIDQVISENMKSVLAYAAENKGKLNDSLTLKLTHVVNQFYFKNGYKNIWSQREYEKPIANVLTDYIGSVKNIGLYPEDYHYSSIKALRDKLNNVALLRRDANVWTQLELLLTDAFMHIIKDVKEGRLVADSNSIVNNQEKVDSIFINSLTVFNDGISLDDLLRPLHPRHPEYQQLLEVLPAFVGSMNAKTYPKISYPYQDSLSFVKTIFSRIAPNDSIQLPDAELFQLKLKNFQRQNGLTVDGKAGREVVGKLNENDQQKFLQIAITLDRYKQVPPIPSTCVWVNIPGFYLKVWKDGNEILWSKVVVGKPTTPTPILMSNISDMVTYPKWTIPESIVKKEILPKLKENPGYLAEKGFNLFDDMGEMVDPYTVDWSLYNTGIPWKVVQGSGDDNALGVLKFNFQNRYSVYLHDTNQRYLFQNANRALSHGCVRVEKWRELAFIVTENDREQMPENIKMNYNEDSIDVWIMNKSRKFIYVKNKLKLYIGYFTCVADNGQIKFFKDIYGSDEALAAKFFSDKKF